MWEVLEQEVYNAVRHLIHSRVSGVRQLHTRLRHEALQEVFLNTMHMIVDLSVHFSSYCLRTAVIRQDPSTHAGSVTAEQVVQVCNQQRIKFQRRGQRTRKAVAAPRVNGSNYSVAREPSLDRQHRRLVVFESKICRGCSNSSEAKARSLSG